MFGKQHVVEVAAWAATGVAVIVAIVIVKGAMPLLAFLIPLSIPYIRRYNKEKSK